MTSPASLAQRVVAHIESLVGTELHFRVLDQELYRRRDSHLERYGYRWERRRWRPVGFEAGYRTSYSSSIVEIDDGAVDWAAGELGVAFPIDPLLILIMKLPYAKGRTVSRTVVVLGGATAVDAGVPEDFVRQLARGRAHDVALWREAWSDGVSAEFVVECTKLGITDVGEMLRGWRDNVPVEYLAA